MVLMAVTILIKKNGRFPNIHVGGNKEMRKRGIVCAKEDELKIWGKKGKSGAPVCDGFSCSDCSLINCSNNKTEN